MRTHPTSRPTKNTALTVVSGHSLTVGQGGVTEIVAHDEGAMVYSDREGERTFALFPWHTVLTLGGTWV